MMGWLTDWLKAIILIILFAAFIDLIVPNQSMQRYVKMVVSLFILLTILTPVLQIFQHDFQWEKIHFPESPFDSILPAAATLPEIMEEGEKLKAQNEQRSIEIVQQQTAEMMKKQLSETMDVHIEELNVVIQTNDEETYIEKVAMKLKEQSIDHPNEGKEDEIVSDLHVEPVFIHIDLDDDPRTRQERWGVQAKKSDWQRQAEEEIVRWMEEHWNLGKDQLSVVWSE